MPPRGAVDQDLGRRLASGPLDSRDAWHPAAALIRYYDRRTRFSGPVFDSFGGGGDRPGVEHRITSEDFVALSALNVSLPGSVSRRLLSGPLATELTAALARLPTDIDLWDATDEMLQSAHEAWSVIFDLTESMCREPHHWAAASKLLARKRPRLLPVYDPVVRQVAQLPDGSPLWASLRHALREGGEANELRRRVRDASAEARVPPTLSELRTLDVILWMYGKRIGLT